MQTVTCLLPPRPYSSAATQTALLAPALAHIGINIDRRFSEPRWWRNLRPRSRHTADVVHVFGLTTFRHFCLSGAAQPRSTIVTLDGHERLTWLDRRWLRRAACITVGYSAAAERLVQQGIASGKVVLVPPAVSLPRPLDVHSARRALGIAADDIVLLSSGSLHEPHVMMNAVWTYEILRYTSSRYHMLIGGDGPEQAATREFAQKLAPEGSNIHFLGVRSDLPQLLSIADAVLITASAGGLNLTLEAMAAGRSIVAHRTDPVTCVAEHEVNSLLVDRDDHPAAAKALCRVLADSALRERLQAQALTTAKRYTIERACSAWQAVYSRS